MLLCDSVAGPLRSTAVSDELVSPASLIALALMVPAVSVTATALVASGTTIVTPLTLEPASSSASVVADWSTVWPAPAPMIATLLAPVMFVKLSPKVSGTDEDRAAAASRIRCVHGVVDRGLRHRPRRATGRGMHAVGRRRQRARRDSKSGDCHHYARQRDPQRRFRNLLTHPWVVHRPGRGGQRPPSESIASAMTASGEW